MATCFRTVSNRFCCPSYFKPSHIFYVENSTSSLRKPVQQSPPKEEINALNVGRIHRISASSQLCCLGNIVENNIDHVRYFPVLSQDFVTQSRRTCELNTSLPSPSDYQRCSVKSPSSDCSKVPDQSSTSQGRPSEEQLQIVFAELSSFLPRFFSPGATINGDLYNQHIILENRIRGTQCVGLRKYVSQIALLKLVAYFKFAVVKFQVLKITKHPEDGTIKCRWRISGVPGMTVIFQFWKFRLDKIMDEVNEAPTWYDGFSTYIVGSDGTIHKHIVDKMMPDDDKITPDKSFASKVTLCLGLLPKEQQEMLRGVVNCSPDDTSYLSQLMFPLEKMSRER